MTLQTDESKQMRAYATSPWTMTIWWKCCEWARIWKTKKTTGIIFLKDISVWISRSYLCQLYSSSGKDWIATNEREKKKNHTTVQYMIIWNFSSFCSPLLHRLWLCLWLWLRFLRFWLRRLPLDSVSNSTATAVIQWIPSYPFFPTVMCRWWFVGYEISKRAHLCTNMHVVLFFIRNFRSSNKAK